MDMLVVIDMQNDFLNASLYSQEAIDTIPYISSLMNKYISNDNPIIMTYDTHSEHYLNTNEGRILPIPHCIINSDGHKGIFDDFENDINSASWLINRINKKSFMYHNWYALLLDMMKKYKHHPRYNALRNMDELNIVIVGTRLDICVISNAIAIKTSFDHKQSPIVNVSVDLQGCSATSNEAFNASITILKSCGINIIGE